MLTTKTTNAESLTDQLNGKALNLYCPLCRTVGSIYCNLACPAEFKCLSCDEEFNASDLEEMIQSAAKWTKALSWLTSMPDLD